MTTLLKLFHARHLLFNQKQETDGIEGVDLHRPVLL